MNPSPFSRRVNGVELQGVEAGPQDGPLVLLLHGFPDFWWGWRHQIEAIAEQGFHVVVPDQRGYNLSEKPRGVAAYHMETLGADVITLADAFGSPTFRVVGHDWGGIIAWWVAAQHPERVERAAILNAPHPDVFVRYVRRHPKQALKSSYAAFFQLPLLPEMMLRANRFAMLRRAMTRSSKPNTFSVKDLERYADVWQQPHALTAMVNYYRALGRRPWRRLAKVRPPVLLVWGCQDVFLEVGVARASLKLCDYVRPLFIGEAGHWVQLEEADRVNQALIGFLK